MNKSARSEIGKALGESAYVYMSNKGQVQPSLTAEWDLAGDVWRIEELAVKLIRSTETPFKLMVNKLSKGKFIKMSRLGERICNCLKIDINAVLHHYPMHAFNPYVDEFVKLASERDLFEWQGVMPEQSDADIVKRIDALNGFVDALRKTGNSAKFKKTTSDFERPSNKNYSELCKYIDAHFKVYSRLLVLRIDLGYKKDQSWPDSAGNSVTYENAKKHRTLLLSYMKKVLPQHSFVGFCWKLEYGLDKHWHYHWLLLLDGSLVREDVTIAKMIGDYWSNTITDGKGLYWNCNANKESYKSCGIGMIGHYDTAARDGLKKAALYMTKTDYYVKLLTPGNGRIFGKGNMPLLKTISMGRPRTRTNYQSEVIPGKLS